MSDVDQPAPFYDDDSDDDLPILGADLPPKRSHYDDEEEEEEEDDEEDEEEEEETHGRARKKAKVSTTVQFCFAALDLSLLSATSQAYPSQSLPRYGGLGQ